MSGFRGGWSLFFLPDSQDLGLRPSIRGERKKNPIETSIKAINQRYQRGTSIAFGHPSPRQARTGTVSCSLGLGWGCSLQPGDALALSPEPGRVCSPPVLIQPYFPMSKSSSESSSRGLCWVRQVSTLNPETLCIYLYIMCIYTGRLYRYS